MSWEYQSEEAALNFSRIQGAVPEEVLSCILKTLRDKSNQPPKHENPEFDSMLDVGCGSGGRIAAFVPHFTSITAIDSSEAQIALARKVRPFNNIKYLHGSGEDMPVVDSGFDLVTFIFSAYYMDMDKVEIELNRILKPNGLAVLYSYLVTGIDVLDKTSNAPLFPDLSSAALNMWDACLKGFKDHAVSTNHPAKDYFNKCENIYQNLTVLNKWKMDGIISYEFCSLEDFLRPYYEALPYFRNLIATMDHNPIKSFGDDLRELWKIPHVENNDIPVRITCSTTLIFLDRKIT